LPDPMDELLKTIREFRQEARGDFNSLRSEIRALDNKLSAEVRRLHERIEKVMTDAAETQRTVAVLHSTQEAIQKANANPVATARDVAWIKRFLWIIVGGIVSAGTLITVSVFKAATQLSSVINQLIATLGK